VRRILRDDEHERVHNVLPGALGIVPQFQFYIFVRMNAVFELDTFQLHFRHRRRIEILPCRDRRLLDEAIGHRRCEIITVDNIAEINRLGTHSFRRCCQFESKHRLEVSQSLKPRLRTVAVCFVHEQHKIGQPSEVVKIAFPYIFLEALYAPRILVDLVHVEDVDDDIRVYQLALPSKSAPLIPIVAGHDDRCCLSEFENSFEDVFRLSGSEVLNKLVVNCGVRREHEEIPRERLLRPLSPSEIEIGDKCSHQPRLADPSR
jgi:hypothetical protein